MPMPATSKAVRWIVAGRVQGVSFRYFTQQAARALGLEGWVKNLPDCSVEALVVGYAAKLADRERRLRQGPSRARVDRLSEEVLDPAADYQPGEVEIRY